MKVLIKRFSVFSLFSMVVSCATMPSTLPEKYNLGNYLEEVDRISVFKDIKYEPVDNQSIILNTDWDDYYLLVLRQPIESKGETVGITSTAAKDLATSTANIIGTVGDRSIPGYEGKFHQAPSNITTIARASDRVVLNDSVFEHSYVIEKIYKLKGKEQTEEIKARLRKN